MWLDRGPACHDPPPASAEESGRPSCLAVVWDRTSARLLKRSGSAMRLDRFSAQALTRQLEPAQALEVRADAGWRVPLALGRPGGQQPPPLLQIARQRALRRAQTVARVAQLA